jgi:hypothetical protein
VKQLQCEVCYRMLLLSSSRLIGDQSKVAWGIPMGNCRSTAFSENASPSDFLNAEAFDAILII